MSIDETLGKLLSEFNTKAAELRALDTQRYASQQRLDDNLKTEAESQVKLQETTAELEAARKELAETRRAMDKLTNNAQGEAARILTAAHKEAAEIVENAENAMTQAAAVVARRRKSA